MASDATARRFTTDERAYLNARLFITVLLGGLYFELVGHMTTNLAALYLAALGILVIDGAGFSAAVWYGRVSVERAMRYVLAPDLVAIVLFTSVLHGLVDAFYPVCVLVAIVYALVVSRRAAVAASVSVSLAYALGHVLGGALTAGDAVLFALKAVAILLVGVIVSTSVDKRRRREEDVKNDAEEMESLNELLTRRVAELQAVSEITEIVHSSLDFDRTGPVVLEIVAQALDIDSCCLFVIDKEKSETLFSASLGSISGPPTGTEYGASEGPLDNHFACMQAFDHTNVMVLFCASSDHIENLSSEDRLVLSAVASELVVAVENSRLYKLTKRLAITDELTGLSNYRHLQQRLDEEIGRAKRYSKDLSLLMLDADDFKRFNDTHGHIAGDVALAEIGAIMRELVREVDVVARYGGEEFSLVLPETDASGAYVVAEKVREVIGDHAFADANGVRCCSLTISVGLATYPTHAWDKESLLHEADDALYHAKNGGKNRVRTPVRRDAEAADPVVAPERPSGATAQASSSPTRADESTGD